MSGYEIEELARIEAALDDLVSPTSEDVFQATRPFDERAIASVAATRGGGGGGGSTPSLSALGPYTVNYNTPGLTDAYVLLDTLTTTLWLIHAVVVSTEIWDAAANFEVVFDPDTTNTPLWGAVDLSVYPENVGGFLGGNAYATIGIPGTKIACDAFGAVGLASGQVQIIVLAYEPS